VRTFADKPQRTASAKSPLPGQTHFGQCPEVNSRTVENQAAQRLREVKNSFQEWTRDGHLRHSSFAALRSDKDPRQIVRE
jgi:ATP-dependent DNA ligase